MAGRLALVALCIAGVIPCAVASSNGADTQPGERVSVNDPRAIGSFVFIRLENDDVVRGTIVRVERGVLTLQHEVLGDIEIPTNRILSAQRVSEEKLPAPGATPTPPVQPPVEQIPEVGPPVEPETPLEPVIEEPEAVWASRVELGLNGSQGNSERLNGQLAFRTTRVTEGTRLSIDANWRVNTNRGQRTANRLTLNARQDWNLPESQWTLFLQSGSEFDEFREFDARVSAGAGFSYRFIEDEDTKLSARIGVGFSRDFGGPDENSVPELITGVDFSHRLTDRQRIVVSGELFPDLTETGEYRSVSNARWEYRLDTEQDLSLSIGVEHRYDTQATSEFRTDVDYFVRLVLGF